MQNKYSAPCQPTGQTQQAIALQSAAIELMFAISEYNSLTFADNKSDCLNALDRVLSYLRNETSFSVERDLLHRHRTLSDLLTETQTMFNRELEAKNIAYAFILRSGLFFEFCKFSRTQDSTAHDTRKDV